MNYFQYFRSALENASNFTALFLSKFIFLFLHLLKIDFTFDHRPLKTAHWYQKKNKTLKIIRIQ